MNRALLLLVFLFGSWGVHAAPFTDPFRPPRQFEAPSDDATKAGAAPRLESVLIAPDRRIAVIDGRQYFEGERFGDGRVLRISEGEVVIRRADRDEKLTMFPDGGRRNAALKGRK
jgi:MSHA biogenesis protein MshK